MNTDPMTLAQLTASATARLTPHYGAGEARWMVRIMMEHLKGYTEVDLAIKGPDPVSDYLCTKVDETVRRLLDDEPIQYIFGSARFYGLAMKVTPATLIPRPETEELVEMIVRDAAGRTDLRVLDICTGSGCIALALGRNLVFPEITATDISADALAVARENARSLKVSVDFRREDALMMTPPAKPHYDIIVSNPPYIPPDEKAAMSDNVLRYEPQQALFVPQDEPLKFYTPIAAYAMKALTPKGRLYFEINPRYGSMLAAHLRSAGWQDVTVSLDMYRKQRFISATRPADD